jgi:hypothetical protein
MAVIEHPKANETTCTDAAGVLPNRLCCNGVAPTVVVEQEDGIPVLLRPESAKIFVVQLDAAGGGAAVPAIPEIPDATYEDAELGADANLGRWRFTLPLANTALTYRHIFMIWFRYDPPNGVWFYRLYISSFRPTDGGAACAGNCLYRDVQRAPA